MLNLVRSARFEGVYCKDHRFHYVSLSQAPELSNCVNKDLTPVNYCFFRGKKWYQDIAYISPKSLKQIIDFADKCDVSVHKSFRALIS